MEINQLTEKILKCVFKVHSALSPGLLENVYKECLYFELNQSGLKTEKGTTTNLQWKQTRYWLSNRFANR